MHRIFQHLLKLKDYLSTNDYRRLFSIGFIILLICLIVASRQCRYESPRVVLSIHKSFNSTNQTRINNTSLTKMIVVSHFSEDLSWLDLFIDEQIPRIIYTRSSDPLARHKFAVNKGREAVAYLRYMVDNYSNLSSSIAFVHGHRTAWHQTNPSDIVIALRALRWNKYNYMPLTSTMTKEKFNLSSSNPQARVNYELWHAVLEKELGPPPVDGIAAPCCASFVVKKEAILTHPRSFYSNISDYIFASQHSDQLTGRTLEYTWHMIFGEPAHVTYTTCDLFVCDSTGKVSVELAEKGQ